MSSHPLLLGLRVPEMSLSPSDGGRALAKPRPRKIPNVVLTSSVVFDSSIEISGKRMG